MSDERTEPNRNLPPPVVRSLPPLPRPSGAPPAAQPSGDGRDPPRWPPLPDPLVVPRPTPGNWGVGPLGGSEPYLMPAPPLPVLEEPPQFPPVAPTPPPRDGLGSPAAVGPLIDAPFVYPPQSPSPWIDPALPRPRPAASSVPPGPVASGPIGGGPDFMQPPRWLRDEPGQPWVSQPASKPGIDWGLPFPIKRWRHSGLESLQPAHTGVAAIPGVSPMGGSLGVMGPSSVESLLKLLKSGKLTGCGVCWEGPVPRGRLEFGAWLDEEQKTWFGAGLHLGGGGDIRPEDRVMPELDEYGFPILPGVPKGNPWGWPSRRSLRHSGVSDLRPRVEGGIEAPLTPTIREPDRPPLRSRMAV
jgi:hypothetical protein